MKLPAIFAAVNLQYKEMLQKKKKSKLNFVQRQEFKEHGSSYFVILADDHVIRVKEIRYVLFDNIVTRIKRVLNIREKKR